MNEKNKVNLPTLMVTSTTGPYLRKNKVSLPTLMVTIYNDPVPVLPPIPQAPPYL